MPKRVFVVVASLLAFLALVAVWFLNSAKVDAPVDLPTTIVSTSTTPEVLKHAECLDEHEVAEYSLVKNNLAQDSAIITIKDKKTGTETFHFSVPISSATNYHPLELHSCGTYSIGDAGYDFKNHRALRDYRRILWKYNYSGLAAEVLSDSSQLSGVNILGDFRVDPKEKYLMLTTGYLGTSTYALIIKDLKTLKDVFTLSIFDIEKQNPDIVGNFGFVETLPTSWTSDGRYVWADLFDGAVVYGFIRIDSTDWSYKLLPAPADVLGGDSLNLETGDITVHPGHVWSGDQEEAKLLSDERRAKGIGTNLYIENLFTHKRTLVAKSIEPNAYFHPRWISSTTLEYYMPKVDGGIGERREFVLPK